MKATVQKLVSRVLAAATFVGVLGFSPQHLFAAQETAAPVHRGGEASLVVPDLS